MTGTNYFTVQELECPCCKTCLTAKGFIDDLNALREAVGHAMKINSGCRCSKHNAAVGGKSGSFHLMTGKVATCAVDVSTADWDGAKKWRFIKIAMGMGWSIGFAKTFIHIDQRSKYPETGWASPVFFTY